MPLVLILFVAYASDDLGFYIVVCCEIVRDQILGNTLYSRLHRVAGKFTLRVAYRVAFRVVHRVIILAPYLFLVRGSFKFAFSWNGFGSGLYLVKVRSVVAFFRRPFKVSLESVL